MTKEILSEMVTMLLLYDGDNNLHRVGEGFFVLNDKGNLFFDNLTNLKTIYEKKIIPGFKSQIAIKRSEKTDKWMINQHFIEWAYGYIYEMYKTQIDDDLKAIEIQELEFKKNTSWSKSEKLDKIFLYKNGNDKNESNLTEIFDKNKDKPGYGYLLSKFITLHTRDDGTQMFSYPGIFVT